MKNEKKKLPIGIENFEEIQSAGFYYIDKSYLIKELLEKTTLKNYEIAEKVGFADPHYFGISFKKATGCTPTEYAREKRK